MRHSAMSKDNYNLTNDLIDMGGVLRHSVDLSTGEFRDFLRVAEMDVADGGAGSCEAGPAPLGNGKPSAGGFPLSTGHISPRRAGISFIPIDPYIEYPSGGSLLRVCSAVVEGGSEKRKNVLRGLASFSAKSERRMLREIARTKRSQIPLFVTLTYPFIFPTDNKIYKRHLDNFFKRLARAFPNASAIWKLEPQQRGAPHYHLLVWGVSHVKLSAFVPQAWYEIAGGQDEKHLSFHEGGFANRHCVEVPFSYNGVMSYVSKYMSKKVLTGWVGVGRWWGVFRKENLPVGEIIKIPIAKAQSKDLFRYMRRFARRAVYKKIWKDGKKKIQYIDGKRVILKYKKMRAYAFPSLSILCNSDNFIAQFFGQNKSNYLDYLKGKQGL